MRIEFDEPHDRATIVVVDERQTREHGWTHGVFLAADENDPKPESSVVVQLGFEGDCRLLWISVEPASVALPDALLAQAVKRGGK